MAIKIVNVDKTISTVASNAVQIGGSSGGIPEAPEDGKQYGRQDGGWTEISEGGSTTKYAQSFTNTDLTDDKITITHNLNSEDVIVNVYDNLKKQIICDEINVLSVNTIELDLTSFVPLTDNYKVVVI